MGIMRYLKPSNWYSDRVEILLKRQPHQMDKQDLKDGHEIKEITFDNVSDSQRFESKKYADIYKKMLERGDYGVYGYIDGKCAFRCWGCVDAGNITIYDKNFALEDKSIYVQYVKTASDYRRMGLAKECLAALIDKFHNENMYVLIDMNNKVSMHLHKICFDFKEAAVIHVQYRFMRVHTNIHWMQERNV